MWSMRLGFLCLATLFTSWVCLDALIAGWKVRVG